MPLHRACESCDENWNSKCNYESVNCDYHRLYQQLGHGPVVVEKQENNKPKIHIYDLRVVGAVPPNDADDVVFHPYMYPSDPSVKNLMDDLYKYFHPGADLPKLVIGGITYEMPAQESAGSELMSVEETMRSLQVGIREWHGSEPDSSLDRTARWIEETSTNDAVEPKSRKEDKARIRGYPGSG